MIIGNLISCICWGIVAAIVVTGATYGLCRALSRRSVQSPVAIAVLAVLLVLSGAQGTMMAGASYARDYVEQLAQTADAAASLSQYPQLEGLARRLHIDDVADTSMNYVRAQVDDALSSYMVRRALWTLAFVVAAMAAIAWAGSQGSTTRTSRGSSRRNRSSLMEADDRPAHHRRRRH